MGTLYDQGTSEICRLNLVPRAHTRLLAPPAALLERGPLHRQRPNAMAQLGDRRHSFHPLPFLAAAHAAAKVPVRVEHLDPRVRCARGARVEFEGVCGDDVGVPEGGCRGLVEAGRVSQGGGERD